MRVVWFNLWFFLLLLLLLQSSFVFICFSALHVLQQFNGLSSRDDEEIHTDVENHRAGAGEGVDRTVLRKERSADGVTTPASSIQSTQKQDGITRTTTNTHETNSLITTTTTRCII